MANTRELSLQITYATEIPTTIHGFVLSPSPGKYHIFLNAADDERQQEESFLHECLHIFRGDLYRDDITADQIEIKTHGIS